MSFRELRNFTEVMRSLGYPRLVSMDNFRSPNFELVADCLHWLIHRYDPGADLADEISTEADRVAFLRAATQLMSSRANIQLNPKRLYAADGYAVKELLKIATLLQEATTKAAEDEAADEADLALSLKRVDAKALRGLVSEITQRGARLHDALGREGELREARQKAIARNADLDRMERSVRQLLVQVGESVAAGERVLEGLRADEQSLETKIDKRRAELERSERRLSTLQSVRPPYMDEYEKLQGELARLFSGFLERFRNLQWLESQLEAHGREEAEKLHESERQLRRMQRRLQDEELRVLRGEQQASEGPEGGAEEDGDEDGSAPRGWQSAAGDGPARRSGGRAPGGKGTGPGGARVLAQRPRPGSKAPVRPSSSRGRKAASRGMGAGAGKVLGSVMGAGMEDEDSEEEEGSPSGGGRGGGAARRTPSPRTSPWRAPCSPRTLRRMRRTATGRGSSLRMTMRRSWTRTRTRTKTKTRTRMTKTGTWASLPVTMSSEECDAPEEGGWPWGLSTKRCTSGPLNKHMAQSAYSVSY